MTTIKCAIYARYSSENQKETSIDDQIRKCREFASSKSWEILEDYIYSDKAISGSSIAPRESFNKLRDIALSEDSPFSYILVDDTSRVARNTREALQVFEELTFNNIYVYYVSQGIDTQKETASEMITLHGMVDSLYIRELAKKTHRGIEGRVLNGFSGGGRRYGYRSEPVYSGKKDRYGNLEPDGYILKIYEQEAEVVLRIFKMFGELHYSAIKIINILNNELKEKGVPLPQKGSYWSVSTVLGSKKNHKGILNNSIYIGKYSWNKTMSKQNPTSGKKKIIARDENEWKVIDMPKLRIVSDESWEKVKKRQKEINRVSGGKYTKGKALYSENLLVGLAKCECGGNMVITSGGKWAKYGCSNNWNKGNSVCNNKFKVDKEVLEQNVLHMLEKELSNPSLINEIIKKINVNKEDVLSKKSAIEKLLNEVNTEISNILKAIKAGCVSETTAEALADSEQRKKELNRQMIILKEFVPIETQITNEQVQIFFKDGIYKIINTIDKKESKELLKSLIKGIKIFTKDEGVKADIEVDIIQLSDYISKII